MIFLHMISDFQLEYRGIMQLCDESNKLCKHMQIQSEKDTSCASKNLSSFYFILFKWSKLVWIKKK